MAVFFCLINHFERVINNSADLLNIKRGLEFIGQQISKSLYSPSFSIGAR
jgi:hypothetical protein